MSQEEDESSSVETASTGDGDESSTHESDFDTSEDNDLNTHATKATPSGLASKDDIDIDTDNAEEYETDDESYEDGTASTDDTDEDTDSDSDSTEHDDDDSNDSDDSDESEPKSRSVELLKFNDDNPTQRKGQHNEVTDEEAEAHTDSDENEESLDSDEDITDDDEDDNDEEAEPQLKYQRLGGGVTKMMENDAASSLKCHPRFLVLGMKSGTVYVLDPHGDIIKQYRPHKNAVNAISIDQNGDHVATCSKDGRVVIRDIFKDVQTVHNFRNQDLLSIELHPNYGTSQMFVTGGRGQQLLLRSIGFFRSDNKVLHSGEGPIYCISWQCELIAWANDRGVKIFDISDHKPIAHINRSNRGSPDPERYKCCLCWENRETLLIGWGDWVKIGRIRTVRTQTGHMMKEVHVTNVFITDFYICGIAPFKEHLILLAFLENDDDESSSSDDEEEHKQDLDRGIGKSKPPELRIVSRRGEWIATDALPINKYKANQAKDYKLVWSHDDVLSSTLADSSSVYDPYNSFAGTFHTNTTNIGPDQDLKNRKSRKSNIDETFYIVSPSDIVASLPRTVEDHIKWLWEKEEYEKAWRQSVLYSDDLIRSKLNPTSLGEEFLKYVLEEDEKSHVRFGDLCSEVCLKNKQLWEKWIDSLSSCGKLNLIIDVIPLTNPQLNARSYELILRELIKNNHLQFLQCVSTWDSNLYDMKTILRDATNRLNEVRRSDPLIQALAQLFRMDEEFDKALEYYLQLKSQLLLHLPRRYNIAYLFVSTHTDNKEYKYMMKNCTIDAIIKQDEEEKYQRKLRKLKKKKEKHLTVGSGLNVEDMNKSDDGYDSAALDLEQEKKINLELNRISSGVFTMIKQHKLWQYIQDKIIPLIELDIFRSSKLLNQYRDDIHPKGANFIIEQVTLRISEIDQNNKLSKSSGRNAMNMNNVFKNRHSCQLKKVSPAVYKKYLKFFMYLYLHELVGCCGDASSYPEFHDYLVALYAEFNTRQLSNFLAVSHHVKFSKALSVCEKRLTHTKDVLNRRNLNECYVFILNRMGNFTEALQVILIKLKDVDKAVKFVEEQSDKSLWNHLIERTLRDADELMPKLLDAVKGHPNVDAQELISKIPNKLKIIGLKQKIIAIFEEYSREKLLTKGTTDILRSDCLKLGNKLYSEAGKGVIVNNSSYGKISICIICQLPLKVYPSYYKEHMARIKKMEELQQRRHDDVQYMHLQEKESAFARISINKSNPFEQKIGKEKESVEEKEAIGSTRLNIKNSNEDYADKKLLSNNKKWSELSETLPSIKVFHCGHFYHIDCYRDAQSDKKYNIVNEEDEKEDEEQDKCLICFSGHGSGQTKSKRRNYRY